MVETGKSEPGAPVRMTIDIPRDLHKRVKLKCVADDRTIAGVMRELLEGWTGYK